MIVGCLGDVVFQVSDDTVRTISNMQWSGSANYSTHKRVNTHALTEFTGLAPDKISFEIFLSVYLGVSPMEELKRLWKYNREGTAVPLTLGNHAYGKYRWNITSLKIKMQNYDGYGNIASATASVSLQEYLRA